MRCWPRPKATGTGRSPPGSSVRPRPSALGCARSLAARRPCAAARSGGLTGWTRRSGPGHSAIGRRSPAPWRRSQMRRERAGSCSAIRPRRGSSRSHLRAGCYQASRAARHSRFRRSCGSSRTTSLMPSCVGWLRVKRRRRAPWSTNLVDRRLTPADDAATPSDPAATSHEDGRTHVQSLVVGSLAAATLRNQPE